MNGDNLNMQKVIGDLKKSIRDKQSELRQSEARIADQERQLQNLDVSLKERTDENRNLSMKLASEISTLESVEKKRDVEMTFHSDVLRKLQTSEDMKKELRTQMHKETLNRLQGHVAVFNQMTDKVKISMHISKGGALTGTNEDINEDISNKMVQLKKIQESFPFEKYEKMMSEIKSNGQLIEANKETETSISMAQKKGLDLDEKMERAKEKIRQLEESSEHDYSTASTVTCVEEEQN